MDERSRRELADRVNAPRAFGAWLFPIAAITALGADHLIEFAAGVGAAETFTNDFGIHASIIKE